MIGPGAGNGLSVLALPIHRRADYPVGNHASMSSPNPCGRERLATSAVGKNGSAECGCQRRPDRWTLSKKLSDCVGCWVVHPRPECLAERGLFHPTGGTRRRKSQAAAL